MNEAEIKAAVIERMLRERVLRRGDLLANEFALENHTRRVDLAFFGERFVGIEIKSAADTLRRLPPQLETYSRYFDEVHIVIAERHREQCLDIVGARMPIWVVQASGLTRIQRPSALYEPTAGTLASYLLLDELRKLCGVSNETRLPRIVLMQQASALSVETVRAAVRESLKRRFGSTSQRFWQGIEKRTPNRTDLHFLGRFSTAKREKEIQHQRATFWSEWNICAEAYFSTS